MTAIFVSRNSTKAISLFGIAALALTACGDNGDDDVDNGNGEPDAGGEAEAGAEDSDGDEPEDDEAEAEAEAGDVEPFETPACELVSIEELEEIYGVPLEEDDEDGAYDDGCMWATDVDAMDPEELAEQEFDDVVVVSIGIFQTDHLSDEPDQWEEMKEYAEGVEDLDTLEHEAYIETEGALEGGITIRAEGAWISVSGIGGDQGRESDLEFAELVDSNL